MEGIIGAGGRTWHTLHVWTRTLQEGIHTLHLPSSTGIRLNVHLSGLLGISAGQGRHTQGAVFPLPDDVCIAPPELDRTLIVTPQGAMPATIASLTVPMETLDPFLGEQDSRSRLSRLRDRCPTVRPDPVLAEMVKAVVAASEAGADNLYAESAAQFIVAHILAPHTAGPEKSTGALSSRQLETVLSYMRKNLEQPVSLDDLASPVAFSRFHFLRCFKAATGCTPYRYLTELRIELARKHLENSNDTVAHIAQRCGFSGPEHFSRSFRRIVGCTPSRYRSMRV
ncbi:helix-turn-helix domain-containing protein [Streptomyces sp. NPDC050523]|uniref:helix-turn-helix domain-containing protein n=1 Tax=Streptomyces sp. NPDC050523 TaxID=3365622 RepID=UPI003788EDB4